MLNIKLLIIIHFIVLINSDANTDVVTVIAKYGQINGFKKFFNGNELSFFLGIPYAEPPLGELRFKKPIPLLKKWNEPFNANQWPNSCAQNEFYLNLNEYRDTKIVAPNRSEDCLYLNVFVPVNSNELQLKPVMVWIHGGAFTFGHSSDTESPHYLSITDDIIIVSMHYRLGIFGFLYSGTDDAPGNVGLWDQVLALKWINENIENFGGDKNRVTIFGASAGGESVASHILSPVSRHLFQNAIIMSGSIFGNDFVNPYASMRLWAKGAQLIGCTQNKEISRLTSEAINCLRKADIEKLNSIIQILMDPKGENPINHKGRVVYGDEFLPQKPFTMLKDGNYKKNLNLLIGINDDEGGTSWMLFRQYRKDFWMRNNNSTIKEAINEIKSLSLMFGLNNTINSADVSQLYLMGVHQNDYESLMRRIGNTFGDYFFKCQTIIFGKLIFEGDYHSNVFQYHYTRKYDGNAFCKHWMGSCHTNDLQFIFGHPFINTKKSYDNSDRHHSSNIMNIFIHFAKYGYPPPQFRIKWPKFYTINGQTILPYYEFSHNESPNKSFGKGISHVECDILWKHYIEN